MRISLGWVFVFSMVIWAIALPLFQDGMFVDGILYATVSRNLALGYGSFWDPYVSQNFMQHFHEQPPLVFWMQSLFFKLDSHSIFPERFYSFCLLLLSLWGISKFWKELYAQHSYWPLLLFLSIPTIRWGYTNNVLENTMLFFDLVAVYFFYKSMKAQNGMRFLLVAILFTFLATFSKGIQGLFPIAVPIFYSMVFNNKPVDKKTLTYTLFAVIGIAVIYGLLLLNSEALESYKMYFEQRFQDFPRTKNANTGNRFKLLYHLIIELAIPVLVCVILLIVNKTNKAETISPKADEKKIALFFLLIAISASFPLMITYEQRGFYLNTSMPYYSLALAVISQSWLSFSRNPHIRIPYLQTVAKVLIMLSCIVGITATVYCAGKPKRDEAKLHDIRILGEKIGTGGKICTPNEWHDWSMRYYFARNHQISIYGLPGDCQFIITPKGDSISLPLGYREVDYSMLYYEAHSR